MKKFILKLILIVIPIIMFFVICEYFLRKIPNDYEYKNNWLTDNSSSIKVLILGTSHTFFEINPEYLSKKSFNAAYIGQSLKYDDYIFNKFYDNIDSLEYLIIPISYFSLVTNMEKGVDDKRVKKYSLYYNCTYHKFEPKYNLEIYDFNAYLFYHLLLSIYGKVDDVRCEKFGWGTVYSLKNRAENWKESGKKAAKRHTISNVDTLVVKENVEYICDMIEKCSRKSIKVILIMTPTYITYRQNLDKEQLIMTERICNEIAGKYDNSCYFNLLESDSIFTEQDYYDADHLNEYGAKKLTLIIESKIDSLDNTY